METVSLISFDQLQKFKIYLSGGRHLMDNHLLKSADLLHKFPVWDKPFGASSIHDHARGWSKYGHTRILL